MLLILLTPPSCMAGESGGTVSLLSPCRLSMFTPQLLQQQRLGTSLVLHYTGIGAKQNPGACGGTTCIPILCIRHRDHHITFTEQGSTNKQTKTDSKARTQKQALHSLVVVQGRIMWCMPNRQRPQGRIRHRRLTQHFRGLGLC